MARVHRLVVGARLGDLLSVDVDHETVRDAGLVGRAIVQRDARHERRLEPAAMLIGRFEIHVGWVAQRGMRRADRLVRDAAVDPDVDRVVAMAGAFGQPERLREGHVVEFEPDIGTALRHEVGQFANPFRVEQRFAVGGIENGQWYAPAALTRDHPVGPRFHRAGDAIFAPGGEPVDLRDRVERSFAEVIDPDEKLLDRAEDDRRLRTPAVGIGMRIGLLGHEHAAVAQQPDDVRVCFENVFADQFGKAHLLGVTAEIVDRRENRETVRFA